ncbi:MAG: hypothetical protein H7067_15250 [Burkholderiales bacterium]|nr:hypothetical protein [Opitutaceae bacterium]
MTEPTPGAELRRTRMQCYLAAAIFAGCGLAGALLPLGLSGVVRGALAGFNLVVALAVWFYGRSLGGES